MHELAEVFTDRKGLVWIAVTAIISVIIYFLSSPYDWVMRGIHLRPTAAMPVFFGILWGPAAAWGLGIGNAIGDFDMSWTPMSIFGFLINVLYPYLSYRFWHRLVRRHEIRRNFFNLGCFLMTALVTTFICMALLAACGTMFFGRPFESRFISYFGNDITWSLLVGPILFWLVTEPAFRHGLVYGREWNCQTTIATK